MARGAGDRLDDSQGIGTEAREGRFRLHAVDGAGGALVARPAALVGRGRRQCAMLGTNACVGWVERVGK
jgi:hypothetical protein